MIEDAFQKAKKKKKINLEQENKNTRKGERKTELVFFCFFGTCKLSLCNGRYANKLLWTYSCFSNSQVYCRINCFFCPSCLCDKQ